MIVDSTHVIEGLSTRVRVSGEGQPLLLIGGLWSQAPMFDPSVPHLDGFRTIAFDPPGIGETDLPTRPYSVQRLAQFAAGVLAAVGVGRADVLGVSLGGAVAQELAHSHPERVDRMVLVSTGPGTIAVPGRLDILMRFGRPTAYTRHHASSSNVPVRSSAAGCASTRSWCAAGTCGHPRARRPGSTGSPAPPGGAACRCCTA